MSPGCQFSGSGTGGLARRVNGHMVDTLRGGAMVRNMFVLAIVGTLVGVVLGVAAWQIHREDRADRAALASRVMQHVKAEGLRITAVDQRDGSSVVETARAPLEAERARDDRD